MTDIQSLKEMYLKIRLNFVSCNHLIGSTVTISTGTKELDFEFDTEGKFLRIV